jgi:hypothetical protein
LTAEFPLASPPPHGSPIPAEYASASPPEQEYVASFTNWKKKSPELQASWICLDVSSDPKHGTENNLQILPYWIERN